MEQKFIEVRGAREHNLKGVDMDIPRDSLVVITGTLAMFGLPVEGVAIILAIDQFLDMGRSATNVIGNAVASAVVAKRVCTTDSSSAKSSTIELASDSNCRTRASMASLSTSFSARISSSVRPCAKRSSWICCWIAGSRRSTRSSGSRR